VLDLAKHTVQLAVRQKKIIPALPCRVTLIQAIPKGKVFDSIVQKATELGAFRIIPLLTDRVITQLDDEKAESKVEHWRTISIESIKQCGSPWLPRIEAPTSLKALVTDAGGEELSLVASLQPGSAHPREWFNDFRAARGRPPATVAVWVGPEGDFTDQELTAIESTGARPITLGRLVLRSDTAATYCLSVVNYELQVRES
jgi:16S rRNA (uracil1498-N3)-methyltransferase